ncbi:uncharacterized protein LOC111031510 isoform X2 [Myzus persicae]|uniref:uncharacterized protein LOC111031510 isoform X2 n=1 Tax=Myzus persicae TaxID=13164 RepID=UPI000B934028|nr:uncharacterized protein LOC111031510 isoform X2 [Myzus persicae]
MGNGSEQAVATKAEKSPKYPAISKPEPSKSETTGADPTGAGMNLDEDTAVEPVKPPGLHQKILKRIKSVFWPIRFVYGKFKNLKNKVQNRNKIAIITTTSGTPASTNIRVNYGYLDRK